MYFFILFLLDNIKVYSQNFYYFSLLSNSYVCIFGFGLNLFFKSQNSKNLIFLIFLFLIFIFINATSLFNF